MAITDQSQSFGGDDNISSVLAEKLNSSAVVATTSAADVAPGQFYETATELVYKQLDGTSTTVLTLT